MIVVDSTFSVMTFCSLESLSEPCDTALPRSACAVASTSACCARNASPSFCVQSSFSLIIVSTCGNTVSDFTLSSQVCCCNASSSALSLSLGLALTQRSALTISSGYVDAIRTWTNRESGYSAIGATSCSSSSFENVFSAGELAVVEAAGGVAGAGACATAIPLHAKITAVADATVRVTVEYVDGFVMRFTL